MGIIEAVLKDTLEDDMSRVENFYLSAPEKDREYLQLHLKDHKHAIEFAFHFIVEMGRQIVASTMINPPQKGERFAEAGNTLVRDPVRGFGLQRFFLELRAAALAVTQPSVYLTTGVNPKNETSYRNVSSSGEFNRWDPPKSYYELCKENKVSERKECKWREGVLSRGRNCCCDFFLLKRANQRKLVQRFLEKAEKGPLLKLESKETGDYVQLLLQSKWASSDLHLRTLRAFVDGRNGLS